MGKLLARLRGQNAKRAATSVAPVVARQRFKLSLPCRSKKGTSIDDDRHSCSSDLSGRQWRRVHIQSMDQDLITALRTTEIREYRRSAPAFVRGETMGGGGGGVFCDSSSVLYRAATKASMRRFCCDLIVFACSFFLSPFLLFLFILSFWKYFSIAVSSPFFCR